MAYRTTPSACMHAFDAETSRLPHVIFSETQYLHINKL
jgi:hypothetical protein